MDVQLPQSELDLGHVAPIGLVFVGRGKRVPSPDHTVFDYFAVLG